MSHIEKTSGFPPGHNSSQAKQMLAGVAPGIFRRGADFSEKGAKIWFWYYKYQKPPTKSLSPSDGGLACSDGGL